MTLILRPKIIEESFRLFSNKQTSDGYSWTYYLNTAVLLLQRQILIKSKNPIVINVDITPLEFFYPISKKDLVKIYNEIIIMASFYSTNMKFNCRFFTDNTMYIYVNRDLLL
ncbi:MAG TPA: hypothetical protein V6C58_14195 [Allocoleopsis sp.]